MIGPTGCLSNRPAIGGYSSRPRDWSVDDACRRRPRGVAVGIGGADETSNTPPFVNLAYAQKLLWDGREARLGRLVTMPIELPTEMDLPMGTAAHRLSFGQKRWRRRSRTDSVAPTPRRASGVRAHRGARHLGGRGTRL